MSRLLRGGPVAVLALVVGLAGLTSACAGAAKPDAATVGSHHIQRSDFEDELHTLVDNDKFRTAALQQDSTAEIPVGLSAAWLQNLVYQSIIDAEFGRRNLKIGRDDEAQALAQLGQSFGVDVFGDFPASFRKLMIARAARAQVLSAALQGPEPTEAAKRAYFREHRADYAAQCPNNRSVAHILVRQKTQADAIAAQLRDGADFATLARENSIDTGSARAGGQLGCLRSSGFVPEFQDAANAATPDVPTAPVHTTFGWHIILVRGDYVTYENFADQVASEMAQQGSSALSAFLVRKVRATKVTIDRRYGTWHVDAQGGQIVPPTAPSPRESRTAPTTAAPPLGAPGEG
jgi:parvulin-like peptidyl-prolyl isomerase